MVFPWKKKSSNKVNLKRMIDLDRRRSALDAALTSHRDEKKNIYKSRFSKKTAFRPQVVYASWILEIVTHYKVLFTWSAAFHTDFHIAEFRSRSSVYIESIFMFYMHSNSAACNVKLNKLEKGEKKNVWKKTIDSLCQSGWNHLKWASTISEKHGSVWSMEHQHVQCAADPFVICSWFKLLICHRNSQKVCFPWCHAF